MAEHLSRETIISTLEHALLRHQLASIQLLPLNPELALRHDRSVERIAMILLAESPREPTWPIQISVLWEVIANLPDLKAILGRKEVQDNIIDALLERGADDLEAAAELPVVSDDDDDEA